MAEYRTIRMAFWSDPFIEELEAGEKLLYLYLFTCPHTNNLGVLEISRRKIAFETGLDAHVVESALERLKKAGKVVTDGNFILLTRFIRHQTTTSPKLAQSLKALLSGVPSEALRDALVDGYPKIFGPVKGERYPAPGCPGMVGNEHTVPDGMRASSVGGDTVSTGGCDDGYPIDRVSIPYQYPIHTQPNGRDTVGIPSGEEEEEIEYITPPYPPLGGDACGVAGECRPAFGIPGEGTVPGELPPEAEGTAGKRKPSSGRKKFAPPSEDEVAAYCLERGNGINATEFVDFYTAKGWMVGKSPMKDWRSAVRTWEHSRGKRELGTLAPERSDYASLMPRN